MMMRTEISRSRNGNAGHFFRTSAVILFAIVSMFCITACSPSNKDNDESKSKGKYLCRPDIRWGDSDAMDSYVLASKHGFDPNEIGAVANGTGFYGNCDQAFRDSASSGFSALNGKLEKILQDSYWNHPHSQELLSIGTLTYVDPGGMSASLGSWAIGATKRDSLKKDLDVTRDSTGKIIAIATDPSNKYTIEDEWVDEFVNVGRTLVWFQGSDKPRSRDVPTEASGPGEDYYGWLSLAPLLRYGDYDTKFLSKVATDIIKFDQDLPKDKRKYWESDGQFDSEGAKTPVEPVLDALSRNKNAAKDVAETTGDERVEKLLKE